MKECRNTPSSPSDSTCGSRSETGEEVYSPKISHVLFCPKDHWTSKLAILRTLPLLYRFKPFHWRVQDQGGSFKKIPWDWALPFQPWVQFPLGAVDRQVWLATPHPAVKGKVLGPGCCPKCRDECYTCENIHLSLRILAHRTSNDDDWGVTHHLSQRSVSFKRLDP